jgi:hypothetical protein
MLKKLLENKDLDFKKELKEEDEIFYRSINKLKEKEKTKDINTDIDKDKDIGMKNIKTFIMSKIDNEEANKRMINKFDDPNDYFNVDKNIIIGNKKILKNKSK